LFAAQNKDFLLEKRYTTTLQQNNKTYICFLVVVIKSMSTLISVVGRSKQACRFHQLFSFLCRFWIVSQLKKHFRKLRTC